MSTTPKNGRRLGKLTPHSLSELAYESIRESIVNGRFAMGEQLVETRLAEDLGISRAPIREALRRLAKEGLVTERPRQGTFVRELTASDFIDIYNLRIAIETAAIRLVTRAQPSLAPLERLIEDMRRAAQRKQVQRLVDLELSFHEELCDASGNDYLASVFSSASAQIRMALSLDDAEYIQLEDVASEHLPLLEAIRSGDEALAARTIEEHIVASVEPVLARLGGSSERLLAHVDVA